MTARLFRRPIYLEWEKEGDQWLDYVVDGLRQFGITGRTCNEHLIPNYQIRQIDCAVVPPNKLRCRLRITLLNHAVSLSVVSNEDDEEPPEEEIAAWHSAVAVANERLAVNHSEFRWRAIITPSTDGSCNQCLKEVASVRSIRLVPHGEGYAELIEYPSLFIPRKKLFRSWPIWVEGTSIGHDREGAHAQARDNLHRLCSLLSLAWEVCWVLRGGPTDTAFSPALPSPADTSSEIYPHYREYVSVPEWLTSAWQNADRDPVLGAALNNYYDGLRLWHQSDASFETSYSSAAFLAFVSSLEGIGSKFHALEKCESCGSTIGSTERFRRAVREFDPELKRKFLNEVYSTRSKKVHGGDLPETISEYEPFRLRPGEIPAVWLHVLEQIGRELLKKLLTKASNESGEEDPMST